MLNKETIEQINNPPRRPGVPVVAALAAGATLAALTIFGVSPVLAAGILVTGIAAAVAAYVKNGSRGVTPLHYDLGQETADRFAAVQRACEELASVEKVWRYNPCTEGKIRPTEDRAAAEVGILETPGISANVEVWGISSGDARLHFFPDCALYYSAGDGAGEYREILYPVFEVAFGDVEKLEEGEVPEDAKILDQTWRHVRDNGGPDLRFTSNPKLTTVSYGTLRLSGPRLELELLVSSRPAAARFARSFGAALEEPTEKEGTRAFVAPAIPEASSTAHAVLGVETGASKSEVTAAYRKLARKHHPDAVAGLDPEAREASEARMKEINAAYAELGRKK